MAWYGMACQWHGMAWHGHEMDVMHGTAWHDGTAKVEAAMGSILRVGGSRANDR
jgi:hypothetical protein